MALVRLCGKTRSPWRRALQKWGLLTAGALGLCYLLSPTTSPWPRAVPSPAPASSAPPPPPPALPSIPPCVANASVRNISGFAELPEQSRDFMSYRHCRAFPQLLDVPGKCGGPSSSSDVFLLLAIKSSPANYERREAIRKTWGQQRTLEGAQIRRVFLVGVAPEARDAAKLNRLLWHEQREHHDVLQWEFRDTFFNLTLKLLLFHTWLQERCPGARFVFNGDDDVFVNTDNVVSFARGVPSERHLLVGQVLANTGPIRNPASKYFVPRQLMPTELYPPYCSGGGVLMSAFTVRAIHRVAQHLALFPIDDVYLGMCLEKAGLAPTSHDGIRPWGIYVPPRADPMDPCYYRELLLVHRFAPYEMAAMWHAIRQPRLRCGREVRVF
ncbi:N-acetyllactosaminide beta-1,3-N-acetylglucosaminyltransferase 3 [Numida meleagris]|uniref:N-acetyllactosaminide beta-1,3-N-acetylglucosaminyltransferase 3 n=1 Tax=Numida meleagris TaxID=8996 RepID=UPI000B3E1F0B|nr:N-acetyllactosaminide beta-1,3-N-acetylglucosaminyltransferase 3 [Numida meleagris]